MHPGIWFAGVPHGCCESPRTGGPPNLFMLVGAQLSAREDRPLGVDEPSLGHSVLGFSVVLESGFPMDFNWLLSFCLTHTHRPRQARPVARRARAPHRGGETEQHRGGQDHDRETPRATLITPLKSTETARATDQRNADTRRAARQTLPNLRRRHTHTGTCAYVTRPCRYIVRSREHRRANLSCDTPPLRRDLRARSRDEATGLGQYSLSLT